MKKKTGRYKCSQKIFDVAKMGPREGVSEREIERERERAALLLM